MNVYERLWTFIKILVWVAMAADVYKQGCERLWTFIKSSLAAPKHDTVYNIKPVNIHERLFRFSCKCDIGWCL